MARSCTKPSNDAFTDATSPSPDPAPVNPPNRGLWHSVALWRSLAIFFVIVMLLAGSAWLSMYEMMTTHINNLSKRLSDTPVVAHLAVLNNGQGEAGVLITYAPQKQQLRLQRLLLLRSLHRFP